MLETTANTQVYLVGLDTTSPFAFAVPFFDASDIHCYLRASGDDSTEIELTSGTQFTVEAKSDYSHGADVTLAPGVAASGDRLVIVREVPLTQGLALPLNGKLPSKSLEKQLDRMEAQIQQHGEKLGRTVGIPVTDMRASGGDLTKLYLSYIDSAYHNAALALTYRNEAADHASRAADYALQAAGHAAEASAVARATALSVIHSGGYTVSGGMTVNGQMTASGGLVVFGGFTVSGAAVSSLAASAVTVSHLTASGGDVYLTSGALVHSRGTVFLHADVDEGQGGYTILRTDFAQFGWGRGGADTWGGYMLVSEGMLKLYSWDDRTGESASLAISGGSVYLNGSSPLTSSGAAVIASQVVASGGYARQTVVTSSDVTSASIVLRGGTSYIFTEPLTALDITDVAVTSALSGTTFATEAHLRFTLASGGSVTLPASVPLVNDPIFVGGGAYVAVVNELGLAAGEVSE